LSECDALSDSMIIDPEVAFEYRQYTVGVAKHQEPSEQQLVKADRFPKQRRNVKGTAGKCTSQSSQTDQPRQQMPNTHRFVHSNGKVDVVTDNTKATRKPNKDHSHYGRRQQTDSDSCLSASETEPDDPETRSRKPTSERQLRELQRSGEHACSQLSVRNDSGPVYFSTYHYHKKPQLNGSQHTNRKDAGRCVSSFTRSHKGSDSSDGSSDANSVTDGDKNKRRNNCQPSYRKNHYPGGDGHATQFDERKENSFVTCHRRIRKPASNLSSRGRCNKRKGNSCEHDNLSDSDSDVDDCWSGDRRGENHRRRRGINRQDKYLRRGDGGSSRENFSDNSDGPF